MMMMVMTTTTDDLSRNMELLMQNVFILFFIIFFSTPLADLYSLSYLWLSGLSFGAATIVAVISSFILGNYIQLGNLLNGMILKLLLSTRGFLSPFTI